MKTVPLTLDNLRNRINEEIGVSEWQMIDQNRINQFAECTGDRQWIHVDVQRAQRDSPFGGPIAHGYLTLALVAPMLQELLIAPLQVSEAINYGLDKLRFVAPVLAGQRVRGRMRLVGLQDKGEGRHLITVEITVEIDGQTKPALIAVALAMLSFR